MNNDEIIYFDNLEEISDFSLNDNKEEIKTQKSVTEKKNGDNINYTREVNNNENILLITLGVLFVVLLNVVLIGYMKYYFLRG